MFQKEKEIIGCVEDTQSKSIASKFINPSVVFQIIYAEYISKVKIILALVSLLTQFFFINRSKILR